MGAGRDSAPRTRALVGGLALACHPAPTAAVTAVSVLLAVGVGLSPGPTAILAAAVLTGQLSIGWSNDRIDAGRDAASARSDKPAAAGRVPLNVVAAGAALALVVTIGLSAALGLPAATAALTLVAAGWAYNLGLKATVLSGATYLVGFGALPAAAYLALPGHPWPPWWVPVTGALLGLGAHFANVLPDLADDAATGVHGLPQRLGPRAGVIVMALTLAAASIVLGFAPQQHSLALASVAAALGIGAAAVVAVLALRSPESPAAFRVTLVLAFVDVGLLIALVS